MKSLDFPKIDNTNIDKSFYKKNNLKFYCISMGNPFAVTVVENFNFDYIRLAKDIQSDDFFPNGINVVFIKFINDTKYDMRVVERGVGETRACGTGAAASVVIAKSFFSKNTDKINVNLLGGELEIEYKKTEDNVYMTGTSNLIGEGTYYFN